jgi:hypothetical protein
VTCGPQIATTDGGAIVARVVGWGYNGPQTVLFQGELATFARDHITVGQELMINAVFRQDDIPPHVRSWDVHAEWVCLLNVDSPDVGPAHTEQSPPSSDDRVNRAFSEVQSQEMFHALHEATIECSFTEHARRTPPFDQILDDADHGHLPSCTYQPAFSFDLRSLLRRGHVAVRESQIPKLFEDCRKALGASDLSNIVILRFKDRFTAVERSVDLPRIATDHLGYRVVSRSADGRSAQLAHDRLGTTITLQRHERGYWCVNRRASAVDLVCYTLRKSPQQARDLLTELQHEMAVQQTRHIPIRSKSRGIDR